MAKSKKTNPGPGLPAGDWEKLFRSANVEIERLDSANQKGKQTLIGNFLTRNTGREIPVDVDGRQGHARLRVTESRGNKKLYYFEVVWDEEDETAKEECSKLPPSEQGDRQGNGNKKAPKKKGPGKKVPQSKTPNTKKTRKSTNGTNQKKGVRRVPRKSTNGNSEDW